MRRDPLIERISVAMILDRSIVTDAARAALRDIVADAIERYKADEVLLAPQAALASPPAPANDIDMIMPLRSNWNTPKRDRIA